MLITIAAVLFGYKQRMDAQRAANAHKERVDYALLHGTPSQSGAMQADTERLLEVGRGLIKAKQYEDAYVLLRTLDHPTAREWIVQLEKRGLVKRED